MSWVPTLNTRERLLDDTGSHDRVPAALAEQEICAAFSHAQQHYGGQFGMVKVVMTTEKQHVAYHDPLADHFYEEVRRVLDW